MRDPSSPDITETVSLLVDHLEAAGDDTAVRKNAAEDWSSVPDPARNVELQAVSASGPDSGCGPDVVVACPGAVTAGNGICLMNSGETEALDQQHDRPKEALALNSTGPVAPRGRLCV